jgi:hypothetical protein
VDCNYIQTCVRARYRFIGLLKIRQALIEMGIDIKLETFEGFIFESGGPESLRQRAIGFNYLPFFSKENSLLYLGEQVREGGFNSRH